MYTVHPRKSGRKTLNWLLLLVILISAGITWSIFHRDKPPVELVNRAGTELALAGRQGAGLYADEYYRLAQCSYDSAMACWRVENEKLFFARDYSLVRAHAEKASGLARLSMEKTALLSGQLYVQVAEKITDVKARFEWYEKYGRCIPLPEDPEPALSRGRISLKQAQEAYRRGDLLFALESISTSMRMVGSVTFQVDLVLEEYFSRFEIWKGWAERTIGNSRDKRTFCLVIDKFARDCILYSDGIPRDSFSVELGPNWIGDKNHQGDRSTPEGIYLIIAKKSGNATGFHKALLLDYPNEEDRKRFRDNRISGLYGPEMNIGSMIEIHGHGGKGADWTDGCIALKNGDMDQLFKWCRIGTEVAIVGSLRPLDQVKR